MGGEELGEEADLVGLFFVIGDEDLLESEAPAGGVLVLEVAKCLDQDA